MSLRMLVSDLLGDPGASRAETASLPLRVTLTNASVAGDVDVAVSLRSLSDGIVARGVATVDAELTCNRCLERWTETLEIPFEQVFRHRPQDEDEEQGIENGAWIDLEPVVHDEVTVSLPLAPLCRPDCRGLCPTCGADLNRDPCDGHAEPTDSPFAVLQELFDE